AARSRGTAAAVTRPTARRVRRGFGFGDRPFTTTVRSAGETVATALTGITRKRPRRVRTSSREVAWGSTSCKSSSTMPCAPPPTPATPSRGGTQSRAPGPRPSTRVAAMIPSSHRRRDASVRDDRRNRGFLRDLDIERRAGKAVRFDPDPAVDAAHELAADVEAESRPADAAGRLEGQAVEPLEDQPLLALRDAGTGVADREAHMLVHGLERYLDRPTVGRVLDGVLDHVPEHLAELAGIGRDGGNVVRREEQDLDRFRQVRARGVDLELGDLARVAARDRRAELAGVELACDQQVVDDLRQAARLVDDHVDELVVHFVAEVDVVAPERERGAVDRSERPAQLVRNG